MANNSTFVPLSLQHVRSTRMAMFRLRESGTEDVVLVSGTHKMRAHRALLAASSSILRKRLLENSAKMPQTQTSVTLELPPFNPITLTAILEFIYTGKMKVSVRKLGQVSAILEAALALEVHILYKKCLNHLLDSMVPSNAVELWDLGIRCRDSTLNRACITFLADDLKDCFRTTRYLNLPFDRYQTVLAKAAQSKSLNRQQLVNAAMCWMEHSRSERHSLISDLLATLQMAHPASSITPVIRKHLPPLPVASAAGDAPAVKSMKEETNKKIVSKNEKCPIVPALLEERKLEVVKPEALKLEEPKNEMMKRHLRLTYIPSQEGIRFWLASLSKDLLPVFDEYSHLSERWHATSITPNISIIRPNAATAVFGHEIYFLGGCLADGGKTTFSCKIAIPDFSLTVISPMLVPKSLASAILLDSFIFCVGGESKYNRSLSHVEFYMSEKRRWRAAESMRKARSLPGLVVGDDKLYAFGGENNYANDNLSCEVYMLSTNEWTEIKLSGCNLRKGPIFVTTCERAIMIFQARYPTMIYCFDDDNFTVVHNHRTAGDVPDLVIACTVTLDREFYVVDSRKSLFAYNIKTNSWRCICGPPSQNNYSHIFSLYPINYLDDHRNKWAK